MKTKGFTLIELLVVIAIIALLVSVVVPSLKAAKEYAACAACLSNQKQLCTAWTMYHMENDSLIVGGSNYHDNAGGTPYRWVERPLYDEDDNPEVDSYPNDTNLTMEYRLNGIRAGRLFEYLDDEEVYHCPRDFAYRGSDPRYASYRSYSIQGLMNGEDFVDRESGLYSNIKTYRTVGGRRLHCVEKFERIKSTGSKYVFVEEGGIEYSQSYNLGSFVLVGGANFDSWWDTPALFHNRQSTLGFADGHAEIRKWHDPRTIDLIQAAQTGESISAHQEDNEDLEWMVRGYMP